MQDLGGNSLISTSSSTLKFMAPVGIAVAFTVMAGASVAVTFLNDILQQPATGRTGSPQCIKSSRIL